MPYNSFDNFPMSWRPVLDKGKRTLYRTLAQSLENDIMNGTLKPGTKLPPQRELADFLDVNVSTIQKAFKVCMLKGLLSATVGSGTFVAYDALTSGRLLTEAPSQHIIDMGATVPEASGNETLRTLLLEMVNENNAAHLFSYNITRETQWQKDAAVRLFAYCGHTTKSQQVLFANGGQNALSAVLVALFRRGDKIAVDAHTYPGIKTTAALLGIQLIPILQTELGMDTIALEATCKNDKIDGVYLIPACHNPTTTTMPQPQRKEVARIVKQYGCILIEDGTYQLMSEGMASISDLIPEQSVYIASLSKAIAPGLRMAYLSVPDVYLSAVSDALYSLNVAVVPMMAELSARIIASRQFEVIIQDHKIYTAQRNDIVDKWLPKGICKGQKTDIFRWLLLPERFRGTEFENLCLSHGVQVYAAERFSVGNAPPAHAVRLSICAPTDLEQLSEGIQILARLLEN